MKASEKTLLQLLHSSDQYVIPVFQRYYTWKTPNWEQLFDDISELLEGGAEQRRHFMGSLVTVPAGHQPGALPAYQIIDGQQRLTTLSILLCALRDVAKEKGWAGLAEETADSYLIHRHRKGRDRYKLFPRLRDRASYIALVDGTATDVTNGQIEAAYRFFHKRLMDRATDEDALRNLGTTVTTRFDFVTITLTGESPYKIFRSLNSTGVDLTEADLIRNHVFMQLPIEEQDEFDDSQWKVLEAHFVHGGTLAGNDLEAFFRDALMRDGTYVGRDGAFEAFERRHAMGKFDPRAVVRELTKVCKLYDCVRGAQPHPAAAIHSALKGIRALNVSVTFPLATTLLERLERKELSEADVVTSLRAIASFVLRRNVCGLSSRGYSSWFISACGLLGAEPKKNLLAFLHSKGWPTDAEFKPRFVRHDLYQSKYGKEMLHALERASQVASEPVTLDGCSVEHVLPQTIDEADDDGQTWITALGANWKAAHAEWLHTPGNLTLVGADYNSEMSNRAFDAKQPVLAASKVYLNQHFKTPKLTTWGATQIQARAEVLADVAAEVWPRVDLA